MSHIEKNSILWVKLQKKKKFYSFWVILEKEFHFFDAFFFSTQGSILWVTFKKSGFNSLSHVEKKGSISMSHVEEKDAMSHVEKKGSILWVIFHKLKFQFCESCSKRVRIIYSFSKKVNFSGHIKKGLNYSSQIKKNSLSHFEKVLWFKFLSPVEQKGSILWAILKRRVQCLDSLLWKIFESHSKKNHFFESYSKFLIFLSHI